MKVERIKRPWMKEATQTRYNPNPKYQGSHWKRRRETFRLGHKVVNGVILQNTMCYLCYKRDGKMVPGRHTDHIIQVKLGGTDDDDNLQTLCDTDHASKSALEGNAMRKKQPGK